MLGQDIGPYTDPVTGYTVVSDEQAYRDASEALVEANRYLAAFPPAIRAFQDFFTMAESSGYTIPAQLITDHADLLTQQQIAEQNQAALQDFVNRYRYYVLGSGLSGLGAAPLVILVMVGVSLVASAIGYFLYRKYNIADATNRLKSETLVYQQWLAQQVQQGLLDPETAKSLVTESSRVAQEATGGFSLGSLFAGTSGIVLVVLAGLAVLSFTRSR